MEFMEMQNRTDRGSSQSIAWFALGAVIGISAAMLLAPAKGSHTRRRISRHVKSGKREMAQEAAQMVERGRRMAETGLAEHLEDTLDRTFERGF
jgi:gas vesicle protein